MPSVYLSPSLQEFNLFIDGGTEEEYANLIADEMEPYLLAAGIEIGRNEPSMSLSQAIRNSNEGGYDLHFSIHSNAAPPSLSGKLYGPDAYYYATSKYGKEIATIVAENMQNIYYEPEKVTTIPTTTLAELSKTKMPSVLVEVAYHDNVDDAQWIKKNIALIAKELARSITEYFGVPFVEVEEEM